MNSSQVGELRKATRPYHVIWSVSNYFSLPAEVNTSYSSPHFYFMNMHWFLKIYPNGKTASEGWTHIFLYRTGTGPPTSVRYAFSIRENDGAETYTFYSGAPEIFSKELPGRGPKNFVQRSKLLSRKLHVAPTDALTVVCTVWCTEPHFTEGKLRGGGLLPTAREGRASALWLGRRGFWTRRISNWADRAKPFHPSFPTDDERLVSPESQTEDLADGSTREEGLAHFDTKGVVILQKHLQDLLLDSKDHDVTLKVKGQHFRAHKNILRSRSPVFAAMFAHNMAENECGEVCIEDCDPNAFGEFLKYVYVGKLENMSPAIATGVYYVADKYDFPDLKETCVKFLKESLTTNVISDVITLAMKHGEDALLECAMEFFSEHVIETLMTVEWQRFNTSNPILANELNVKAMKISRKNTE